MGNPYAGLDEAGAGNVTMGAGLRPTTKGVDEPPGPKARAPVLDPTDEGRVETEYGSSGIGRWEEMTIRKLRNLTRGATLLLYSEARAKRAPY